MAHEWLPGFAVLAEDQVAGFAELRTGEPPLGKDR